MDNAKLTILNFLKNENFIFKFGEKFLTIILILIFTSIAVKIINKLTDYIIKTKERANTKFGFKFNEKRSETLHNLSKSVIKYTIYFIAFFQILAVLGINTTSIIASAGILSVAIGFGAQNLVKDIITGFFIILEGQFDVGDYVKINNLAANIAEGEVLALGMRSTKILSKTGEVHFIPNSAINQVVNYSLTFNLAKVVFPLKITSTLEQLEKDVTNLLTKLNNLDDYKKYFYKNEKLKLVALDSIEDNIVSVKILVKVRVSKKEKIETLLRRDFYNEFKERIKKIS